MIYPRAKTGVFLPKEAECKKNSGFAGQIKSFHRPDLPRGPYVVHANFQGVVKQKKV